MSETWGFFAKTDLDDDMRLQGLIEVLKDMVRAVDANASIRVSTEADLEEATK